MTKQVFTRQGQVDSEGVKIEKPVESIKDAVAGVGHEQVIETTPVYASEALAFEAFMRDEIEVCLMEPGNENDAQSVEINVNGDYRLVMRDGQPQKLRRYHVAVLAQAKQSRVRQRKVVNQDGSMAFVDESVLSLTYPFTVTNDPNPRKGGPWLREMLRSPV